MPKRKLSAREIKALRAAYEQWNPHDPGAKTAAELAAEFGISKQTMYTYRERWLEERRQERIQEAGVNGDQVEAIKFLVEELMAARAEISRLEALLNGNEPPT